MFHNRTFQNVDSSENEACHHMTEYLCNRKGCQTIIGYHRRKNDEVQFGLICRSELGQILHDKLDLRHEK